MTRWHQALALVLAMCCPCAVWASHEDRQDPEALLLLEEAARRSAPMATLSASFQQEKKLSILAQPLPSQGYMCVTRAAEPARERVLWAYTSPTPSGFVYENGQGFLWETHPARKRPAAAWEAGTVTAVVRHILAWIHIDATSLQQAYRLERPDRDKAVLLLYPRRQSFFIRLETEFAPTLDSVRQLTFFEANGDTVRIVFTDTQINKPLPERCAP